MTHKKLVRSFAIFILLAGGCEMMLMSTPARGIVPTTYDLGGGGLQIGGGNVVGTGITGSSSCGWSALQCALTLAGPVVGFTGLCAAFTGPLSPLICYAYAARDAYNYAVCCR